MPTALDAVLGALPPAQAGAGTALSRTLQQIGASFGVAILGSTLNNGFRSDMTGHLAGLPVQVRAAGLSGVAGATAAAHHLPGPVGQPLIRAADDAYARGMAEVLLVAAGLMVAGAVLVALFLPARAAGSRDGGEAGDVMG
jgi:hypothetical protein